ncbi:MAG: hypothetical protein GXX91_09330 [Verrucomicrobiaceae bacterium]|nr:hypothetical protein [Verrucomicrobiaceae bacterium]
MVLFPALAKAPASYAQDAATPSAEAVEVTEIPDRFFSVQDSSGFFWQAYGNGALVSGDVQYLQSGLNLLIDGTAFAPAKASLHAPQAGAEKTDIRLEEKRGDLTISRDLWFDTRRSAVRVFDTVRNDSETAKTVNVSLRTTYPFAWQSLHGSGGGLLSHDPVLQLGARDYSLCVHFSPSEGRHDTLFVMGSEKGGQIAELKASANSRELTFLYSLEIPAGESRRLLHWILQRNLADVTQDLAAISPFLQRDKLIVPEVDPAAYAEVVNFAPSAFQIEASAPAQIKALVALNRLTDRIGFHRRSEDILWISPTNQIAGTVKREGSLTVATAYTGDREVAMTEIAAIRGGGGNGRNPLVYLRDGRVFAGAIREGAIEWTPGNGGASDTDGNGGAAAETADGTASAGEKIDPAGLGLLLLATEAKDGVVPTGATHFLQLLDGTVLPVLAEADRTLELMTPWGPEKWLWSDLVEAGQISRPSPRLRAIHRNGTEISALLASGTWSLETPGGTVEIPSSVIDHLWSVGATAATRVTGTPSGAMWLDFAEVPTGQGPPTAFLLAGNHLVEAGFAGEALTLTDAGQEWRIETSRIVSLRRPVRPEADGLLEVELNTGETFTGRLASAYLPLVRNGVEMAIPESWVLGYRRDTP